MSMPDVKRFAHGSRVPGWDDAVDLSKDPQEIPDPATTPVPADLREEIEHHIATLNSLRPADSRMGEPSAGNSALRPVEHIDGVETSGVAETQKN
jgi:hypothetical protein